MDKTVKQFTSVPNYLRHWKNLTIAELSERTEVATSTISRIERGNLAVDISHVSKLAEFYGVTVDALLRNDFKAIFESLGEQTAPIHKMYEEFAKVNAIFQRNGLTGENWVYLLESRKLENTIMKNAVNANYADDAEAHFDILSFSPDGQPIVIEVKSTTKGPNAPFYMSAAELQTAKDCVEADIRYEIHRVYYVHDARRVNRFIITGKELLRDYDITPQKYMVRKKVVA